MQSSYVRLLCGCGWGLWALRRSPCWLWGFCTTRSPLTACRRRVGPSCSAFPPSSLSWLSSSNFACNFPEQSCLFVSVRIVVSLVFWNCMRLCGASTCALRSLRCPASGICAFWIGTALLDRLFSYPEADNLSRSSFPIQFVSARRLRWPLKWWC